MVSSVTFYGTSSAIPSRDRGFACIGLSESETKGLVLLDCGDGAIRNLLRFGADVNSISDILVSHYHSDHVTGITQIIETMGIRKRKTNLRVCGPLACGIFRDGAKNNKRRFQKGISDRNY